MELYKKYRPPTLKKMVGNKETIKSLQTYLDNGNLPNCLLLTGPTGCGKTTIARILKTELQADTDFGYKELDATIFKGIDTSRDLAKEIQFKPVKGKSKIIVLEEAHSFGVGGASEKNQAQTGLLKTLENGPDWCYFILTTNHPEMLIPALRGRCTQFAVNTLSEKETKLLLMRIAKKEDIKINKEITKLIFDYSLGHARNAVQFLSKISTLENIEEMEAVLQKEVEKQNQVKELCYALLDMKGWGVVKKILLGLKKETPETIRRSVLGMMESALLQSWGDKKAGDPWIIMSWFYDKNTYDSGFSGIVFCCKAICDEVESPY